MASRAPGLAVLLVLGVAIPRVAAQEGSVWTPGAVRAHERANVDYGRWVRARHDLDRTPTQNACFDHIANRAGALTRMLEDRAELGRIPAWSVADTDRQLDDLEEEAVERCTLTNVVDAVTVVEVWRDPFMQRMPRDRALLRVGGRFEMVPRVQRGGYALTPAFGVLAALGGFVSPWLRVEGTVAFGWQPSYGPHGSVGARVLITAPWSLFRLGAGLAASVVLATDRLGNIEFGWLGLQIELPLELAWEISESLGITLTGGPIYTQAGQVRVDARALGFTAGLVAELVL